MSKSKKIHSIDTLERELFRLKLEARMKEEQFEKNIDWFRKNYKSLLLGSLLKKEMPHENGKNGSSWKNEKLHNFFDKIADRITCKVVDRMDEMFDNIFRRKK